MNDFEHIYIEIKHDSRVIILKDPPIVKGIIKLLFSSVMAYLALSNAEIAKYITQLAKFIF